MLLLVGEGVVSAVVVVVVISFSRYVIILASIKVVVDGYWQAISSALVFVVVTYLSIVVVSIISLNLVERVAVVLRTVMGQTHQHLYIFAQTFLCSAIYNVSSQYFFLKQARLGLREKFCKSLYCVKINIAIDQERKGIDDVAFNSITLLLVC